MWSICIKQIPDLSVIIEKGIVRGAEEHWLDRFLIQFQSTKKGMQIYPHPHEPFQKEDLLFACFMHILHICIMSIIWTAYDVDLTDSLH